MHQDTSGRRQRRKHSPAYKAELVQLCLSSGSSLASIALDHGLNSNLLRRWVLEHERLGLHDTHSLPATPERAATSSALQFIPLTVQPASASSDKTPDPALRPDDRKVTAESFVRIELTSKRIGVTMHWPTSHAQVLATLLREWVA